jgi:uncharacterized protein (DUF58 family)
MIPRELLKKIRRIEIHTAHSVNDIYAGQYHSAFKGLGIEFQEVREYQPGDEVRTIDWNVTARHGRPFVKLYREERELTVFLLVDVSRSHLFGTAGQVKRELAAELGATLAFSAIKNNDKVGLICFADQVEKFVPPKKGAQHVLRVIRELLVTQSAGHETDIGAALMHLDRVTRRRAVVFVISDFQDAGYETHLRAAKRRHDVIPVVVTDPRERAIPDVGLLELADLEAGRSVLVDTGSRRWRREYERRADAAAQQRARQFRSMNIDTIEVSTGEPFVQALTTFFRARERRR